VLDPARLAAVLGVDAAGLAGELAGELGLSEAELEAFVARGGPPPFAEQGLHGVEYEAWAEGEDSPEVQQPWGGSLRASESVAGSFDVADGMYAEDPAEVMWAHEASVLLVGFPWEQVAGVRAALDEIHLQYIKVLPCFEGTLNEAVGRAVQAAEPLWEEPCPPHFQGAPLGMKQVMLFTNVLFKDVNLAMGVLEDGGMPPVAMAQTFRADRDRPLGELAAEAFQAQQESVRRRAKTYRAHLDLMDDELPDVRTVVPSQEWFDKRMRTGQPGAAGPGAGAGPTRPAPLRKKEAKGPPPPPMPPAAGAEARAEAGPAPALEVSDSVAKMADVEKAERVQFGPAPPPELFGPAPPPPPPPGEAAGEAARPAAIDTEALLGMAEDGDGVIDAEALETVAEEFDIPQQELRERLASTDPAGATAPLDSLRELELKKVARDNELSVEELKGRMEALGAGEEDEEAAGGFLAQEVDITDDEAMARILAPPEDLSPEDVKAMEKVLNSSPGDAGQLEELDDTLAMTAMSQAELDALDDGFIRARMSDVDRPPARSDPLMDLWTEADEERYLAAAAGGNPLDAILAPPVAGAPATSPPAAAAEPAAAPEGVDAEPAADGAERSGRGGVLSREDVARIARERGEDPDEWLARYKDATGGGK